MAGLAVLEGSAYRGEAAVAARRGADLLALVRSGRPQFCRSQPADGCLTARFGDWGFQAQLETRGSAACCPCHLANDARVPASCHG